MHSLSSNCSDGIFGTPKIITPERQRYFQVLIYFRRECTFSKVRPEGRGDCNRRSDFWTAHFTYNGDSCIGGGNAYHQQYGNLGLYDEHDFKLLLCVYGGISLQKAPHTVRRCGGSCLWGGVPDCGDDALELAGCSGLHGLSAGGGGGAAADGISAVQSLEGWAERGDYVSDL